MRVAWYALGGGLGHLNRALAVLRHLRPRLSEAGFLLIASSPYTHLAIAAGLPVLRVPGAMEGLTFPKGATGLVAAAALERLAPLDLLVVDTFPDGLHGELTPEVLGLARRRALIDRDGAREPSASRGLYDAILAPYPASADPAAEAVGYVVNRHPGEALAPEDARRRLGLPARQDGPSIVAMHAGDPGEVLGFFAQVRAACACLKQPHTLRLLTPLPLPGDPWPEVVHPYPASETLPAADLVIAGGGYNSHAELRLFGRRALFRPFDRSHDRQADRLGPLEPTFDALTPPAELAGLIEEALARPAPAPAEPGDYEGAARAAAALVRLVRG